MALVIVSAGSDGPGGEQLGQVVAGADERPLGLDLDEAAQEELAKAAGVLDLADHRLDRLLAQAIARAPAGGGRSCRWTGRARPPRPAERS